MSSTKRVTAPSVANPLILPNAPFLARVEKERLDKCRQQGRPGRRKGIVNGYHCKEYMRIEELNAKIQRCTRCRLCETRIHAVCGEGNLLARLMLIAQAPGEKEDRVGTMFIGPSGKVLDELLKIANIDRNNIYMTNLVKCMLPKYRRPKSDEIETCSRYLDREIDFIGPRLLAPLGYFATRYIFGKYDIPIPSKPEFRKLYGNVVEAGNKQILPLQHPAAVLHDASIKEILARNYQKMGLALKAFR